MALTGRQIQIDKIQVGYSPRFTAITAGTLVRKGEGIVTGILITAPAGAVIDLWDGPVGTGQQILHVPATLGPGYYPVYQSFANDLNIVIATAVTDILVETGGI